MEYLKDLGYNFPYELRFTQEQGILYLLHNNRSLLGDTTGFGKTIQLLVAYHYLVASTEFPIKLLYVTKKTATPKVASEIEEWFNKGCIFIQSVYNQSSRVGMYPSWGRDSNTDILVVSWPLFKSDFDYIYDLIDYRTVIIYDEAHVFKTPETKTYNMAGLASIKASWVWGATATPFHNSPVEFWSILSVLDPDYAGNFYEYLKTFFKYTVIGNKYRIKYVHPSFYNFMENKLLRRVTFEGQPDVSWQDVHVDIEPDHVSLIDEVKKYFIVNGFRFGSYSYSVELCRLQQAIDIPHKFGLNKWSPKMNKTLDIINNTNNKVVIYASYKEIVDSIVEFLRNNNVECNFITGDITKESDRHMICKDFMDFNSSTKVMVLDDAGGESIDLQSGQVMIFYNLPWSNIMFHQVIGRIRRMGSIHKNIDVYNLIAGEIDMIHYRVLLRKNSIADSIQDINEKNNEWIREIFNK